MEEKNGKTVIEKIVEDNKTIGYKVSGSFDWGCWLNPDRCDEIINFELLLDARAKPAGSQAPGVFQIIYDGHPIMRAREGEIVEGLEKACEIMYVKAIKVAEDNQKEYKTTMMDCTK